MAVFVEVLVKVTVSVLVLVGVLVGVQVTVGVPVLVEVEVGPKGVDVGAGLEDPGEEGEELLEPQETPKIANPANTIIPINNKNIFFIFQFSVQNFTIWPKHPVLKGFT